MITGAYETRPGIMQVQLLNTQTETIEELYVYTEDYLQCWDNGVPVQLPGNTDSRGGSTASDSWVAINMDKQEQRRRIAREIEDTIYAYHVYPHMAMVPDFFLRYWDLAEAICDYFDVPFHKPKLTTPEEFEALKGTIKIDTDND